MSIQLGSIYCVRFFGTDLWERSEGKPLEMLRVELVEERQAFGNGDCETFDWFRVTHLGQYNNDLYDIVIDMTFPNDCAGCAGGLGGRVWGSAGIPLTVTGKTVKVNIPHIARGFTEEIRVPRCAINRTCNDDRHGVDIKIGVSVPPPNSTVAAVTPLRTLGPCRCVDKQCAWPDDAITKLPSL